MVDTAPRKWAGNSLCGGLSLSAGLGAALATNSGSFSFWPTHNLDVDLLLPLHITYRHGFGGYRRIFSFQIVKQPITGPLSENCEAKRLLETTQDALTRPGARSWVVTYRWYVQPAAWHSTAGT